MTDQTDTRLAYRHLAGRGPAIVFLPGYGSDMTGTKATALAAWAAAEGRAMLRFDYAGCGQSGGRFEAQTLPGWRDDALTLIDQLTEGPVLLVGSSMGGWLMLMIAEARKDRIAGLVGIAAAPDFTDWGFTQDDKMTLLSEGQIARQSDEGEPQVTTRAFWSSGEANRLMHRPLDIDAPVRLLHGMADSVVPWMLATQLAAKLRSADVQVVLVKDGDHRLSRDADIALLIGQVADLAERA